MTRESTSKSGAALLCMASERPLVGIPEWLRTLQRRPPRFWSQTAALLAVRYQLVTRLRLQRHVWKAFLVRFSVFLVAFNYAL